VNIYGVLMLRLIVLTVRYTLVVWCSVVAWSMVMARSMVVVWLAIVLRTTAAGRTTDAGRTTIEEDAVATRGSVLLHLGECERSVSGRGGETERDSVSTRTRLGRRGSPQRRTAGRGELQRPRAGVAVQTPISPSVGASSSGGVTGGVVQCRGPSSAV